jgi:hypothetical protein
MPLLVVVRGATALLAACAGRPKTLRESLLAANAGVSSTARTANKPKTDKILDINEDTVAGSLQ